MGRFRYKQRILTAGMRAPRTDRSLEAARQCRTLGQWDQAAAHCRRILRSQPDHLEAVFLLAVSKLESGNAPEAAELLEGAIRLNPSRAVLHGQLGNVLQAQGRLDDAGLSYRRALALEPDEADHYNNLGNVLWKLGRSDEAMTCYNQGLARTSRPTLLLNNMANLLQAENKKEQALECYRKVLELEPGNSDALQNAATTLRELGRLGEALDLFERLVDLNPGFRIAHLNLGVALQAEGKLEEAARCQQKLLACEPPMAAAHNNLGSILKQQGKLEEAILSFQKALELDPNLAVAHRNLGITLRIQGKNDEALRCFDRVLELEPENAEVLNDVGTIYSGQEKCELALQYYEKSRAIKPDFAEVCNNLGNLLRNLDRLDEAVENYQTAISLKPVFPEAYSNFGNGLKDQGRFEEAIAAYATAMDQDPTNAGYRWNKSLAELSCGQFETGWEDYEWGFECKQRQPERPFSQPRWQGESLTGKTILAWAEQGLGDEIIFANCLPDLAAAADQCIVECDPRLVPLFARSFPDCELLARSEPPHARTGWPDIDLQVPFGSLPRWFRPSLDRFPEGRGFLRADPLRVAYWKQRLAELGPGLKVGVSWRSRMMTATRARNYVQLEHWGPILGIAGVTFINLQYCDYADDIAAVERQMGVQIHHFEDLDLRNDLDEVAALITALDLNITVGNINVSLGGALHTETWLFGLRHTGTWLNLGTDYTPWFPSVRIFWRDWNTSWNQAVEQAAAELQRRSAQA